jgi:hypothetical protein
MLFQVFYPQEEAMSSRRERSIGILKPANATAMKKNGPAVVVVALLSVMGRQHYAPLPHWMTPKRA